ncbi:MAG: aminotransferase class I/II-fold pyridoxal phosphate-dependent enzyme [Acidobacteriota bacterium]|nr:aminotransferase class I/II-fold pyridoxal phosphate-dependent enzyme [Acidobacteriota bacterium]
MTTHPAVKLDLNERSEGAPRWARRCLENVDEEAIWRYADRRPLEVRIAARFGLEPDQVLATNGSDEGILYMLAWQGRGRTLYMPEPCFEFCRELGDIWGLGVQTIPAGENLELDLEALRTFISAGTGGLLVLARPNNPTGEVVSYEAILPLLQLCKERDVTVLVDEAYAEFAEDDLISTLAVFDNLVILRTFSKAFGLAGLRVGYLMGHSKLIGQLRKRALPYNISAPALVVAERALQDDAMADMRAYAKAVAGEREGLFRRLTRWGVKVFPGQGNFLLLQLGRAKAELLYSAMKLHGIDVRRFENEELAGCLRLSVPSHAGHLYDVLGQVLDPELICLDIDGCLIDTRDSFDAVVAATVKHFTGQDIEIPEIYELRSRGGFNDDNVISHALIAKRGVEASLDSIKEVFRDFYLGAGSKDGLYKKEKVLINKRLLTHLCKRFKVALITGRNREELAPALELMDLPQDMPCWTIDDVKRGKPDPEGILAAAGRFEARRVWMVGDNPDDVRAARAAGALPIGVEMGNSEALRMIGAVRVMDSVNQLEELI